MTIQRNSRCNPLKNSSHWHASQFARSFQVVNITPAQHGLAGVQRGG
jgi:hypothetical protein